MTKKISVDDAEFQANDAYIYLNLENPAVAWGVARGVLPSARYIETLVEDHAVPISFMLAGMLECEGNPRYPNELIIDEARLKFGPKDTSSRLWGMFCFPDLESAQRAASLWNYYFIPDNLVAVEVEGAGQYQRFDFNWITFAPLLDNGYLDTTQLDWLERYWSGDKFPRKPPVWEIIIDGKMTIFGTEVRKRAYERICQKVPKVKGIA